MPGHTSQPIAIAECAATTNPSCHTPTTGPRVEDWQSVSIGVAAHIYAAAPGGARFLPSQDSAERAGVGNGIWLCQNCAKLIDNDSVRFTAELLAEWKQWAENWALSKLGAAEERSASSSGFAAGVASMSNQPTPALACLEHLRLENIHAPWSDMPPLFAAARIMTDGAGARLGWSVAELTLTSEESISVILDSFENDVARVSLQYRLDHHFLAIVAHGGNAGQNESLADRVAEYCKQSGGQRGIRVLVGFLAGLRFVDKVLIPA